MLAGAVRRAGCRAGAAGRQYAAAALPRPQLDLKWVRDNADALAANAEARGVPGAVVLETRRLYDDWCALEQQTTQLREERNAIARRGASGDVSELERDRKRGREIKEELNALESRRRHVRTRLDAQALSIPNVSHVLAPNGDESCARLLCVVGDAPSDEARRQANPRLAGAARSPDDVADAARDHVAIGQRLGILDMDAGTTIAGAKFPVLQGAGALLELALVQWTMLTLHSRFGFTPTLPPDLARREIVEGCGFRPRATPRTEQEEMDAREELRREQDVGGEEGKRKQARQEREQRQAEEDGAEKVAWESNVYGVENTDLCLAATSEIAMGGLFAGSQWDEATVLEALPFRRAAFSHCFRREAGAAGRASRGLYRVHQFSKVEMFVVAPSPEMPARAEPLRLLAPTSGVPSLRERVGGGGAWSLIEEQALGECGPGAQALNAPFAAADSLLEDLVAVQLWICEQLGLHARALEMPTQELGAPARRKIDVEAWMPGRGAFGEVCSASDCGDFQARRLNIRHLLPGQPHAWVHATTLNATALAVPRIILAILETHVQPDGSVRVPDVLHPFLGGLTHIRAP